MVVGAVKDGLVLMSVEIGSQVELGGPGDRLPGGLQHQVLVIVGRAGGQLIRPDAGLGGDETVILAANLDTELKFLSSRFSSGASNRVIRLPSSQKYTLLFSFFPISISA